MGQHQPPLIIHPIISQQKVQENEINQEEMKENFGSPQKNNSERFRRPPENLNDVANGKINLNVANTLNINVGGQSQHFVHPHYYQFNHHRHPNNNNLVPQNNANQRQRNQPYRSYTNYQKHANHHQNNNQNHR